MEPGKKGTMVRIILSHTRRDRPLAFILKERKVHGELAAGKTTWSGTQRSHVCGSEADGSEELGGNEASEETSTTSDGEVYLTSGSGGGSGLGSGPTRERFERWSRQVGREGWKYTRRLARYHMSICLSNIRKIIENLVILANIYWAYTTCQSLY